MKGLLLVFALFLVVDASLTNRLVAKASDVAGFLRVQAQEFAVEIIGVALRHFRRFIKVAGGAEMAKKLLLEAVEEFAQFVRDMKPEMIQIIRNGLRAAGNFAADNQEEIESLYIDVREEVLNLVLWLKENRQRKTPEEIFLHVSGLLSAMAEKHEQAVADLVQELAKEAKDFKKKNKKFIRKIKREIKGRADDFDDERDHEVDKLLDWHLDHIANGFVIELRFNLVRYYARIAVQAIRSFFRARPWTLSEVSFHEARREEASCRQRCADRRSWREALLGWTQERSSVAGRTLGCQVRCASRFASLRPLYLRYVFEQASLCDPQNGIIHHTRAKLFGNKERHEGYVTCARRIEKQFLLDARLEDVARHRAFFNPSRVISIVTPRAQSLVRDIADAAREN